MEKPLKRSPLCSSVQQMLLVMTIDLEQKYNFLRFAIRIWMKFVFHCWKCHVFAPNQISYGHKTQLQKLMPTRAFTWLESLIMKRYVSNIPTTWFRYSKLMRTTIGTWVSSIAAWSASWFRPTTSATAIGTVPSAIFIRFEQENTNEKDADKKPCCVL